MGTLPTLFYSILEISIAFHTQKQWHREINLNYAYPFFHLYLLFHT